MAGPVVYSYRWKRGRAASNKFAIVTSILSLLVAAAGTTFTVLRARVDDQSKLRTELTETDRRLTQVTFGPQGPGVLDERASIAAQMDQIINDVRGVGAIYYQHLAAAENATSRYRDALLQADRGLARARSQHDLFEEAILHRVKGVIYRRLGDSAKMRREFALDQHIVVGHLGGALGGGLRNEGIEVLKLWANSEADFGNCQQGSSRLDEALTLAKGAPPQVRKGSVDSVQSARKQFKTSCVTSTGSSK
jgi:hypothetical protein